MKLKIYLRGLGIGIVVTTLILGISSSGKKEMSDAEVIGRAKKLGMVETEAESGRLSEGVGTKEIETKMSGTEELSSEEVSSEELSSEEVSSEDDSSNEDEVETSTGEETLPQVSESEKEAVQQSEVSPGVGIAEPIDSEQETPKQTVEVTIVSGDDSAAASRRIFEAGLVESATDLDKYLCSNGYSKKVVSGTYKIPVGADNETIAKIITKNR